MAPAAVSLGDPSQMTVPTPHRSVGRVLHSCHLKQSPAWGMSTNILQTLVSSLGQLCWATVRCSAPVMWSWMAFAAMGPTEVAWPACCQVLGYLWLAATMLKSLPDLTPLHLPWQQASLSLLSAGPRMSRGSAAFSPLGGSGSGQPPGSRQSPATTSDRPDTGASNAGSGARPSTSRQQPLQSSLDSARHGGSWQSLQSVRTDPSDGADAMTPHRSEQEGIAEAGRQASRLTPEQQQQQAGQAQPREQRQAQPPAEPEQDPAAGSGIGPAGKHLASFVGSLLLSCCRQQHCTHRQDLREFECLLLVQRAEDEMEPAAGSSGAAAGAIAAGRLQAAVLSHIHVLVHEDCMELQAAPDKATDCAHSSLGRLCSVLSSSCSASWWGLVRWPGCPGAPSILSTALATDCRGSGQAVCTWSVAVADKPCCMRLCHSAADAQAATAFAADGKALIWANGAPAALPSEGSKVAPDEQPRPLPADASRRSGQGPRTLSPHNSRNRGPSQESAGSAGPESSSRSQRSSFARERASVDGNRASLEMFQAMAPPPAQVEAVPVSYEDMELMCDQLGIPKAMRDRCVAAAALILSALRRQAGLCNHVGTARPCATGACQLWVCLRAGLCDGEVMCNQLATCDTPGDLDVDYCRLVLAYEVMN